jgi:hypothetical protein
MRNTNRRSRRRTARRRTTRRNTRRRTNRRNTRRTRRNIQSGGMFKGIGGGGGGGDGGAVTPVISQEARIQAGVEEAAESAKRAGGKLRQFAAKAASATTASAGAVGRAVAGGDELEDPRESEITIEGTFLKKGKGDRGTFKKYKFTFTVNDGRLKWTRSPGEEKFVLIGSKLNTITPVDTGVELQLFPHDGQAWDESRGVGNPLIFKFSDHFDASIYHSAFMKSKELAETL